MSELEPSDENSRRETRIGNPEREQLLDLLKTAVDEGYLTLEEFDERQQIVLAAKTAEAAEVTVEDLPQYQSIQDRLAAERDKELPLWMVAVWISWGAAMGINLTVWMLVLLATGSTAIYWPLWVLLTSGIAVGALTLLEKLVIRPAVAEYRQRQRQRRRPFGEER